ncbi:MAG: radical SAM protein [Deltaproteobacteria bacterium]|nr:radical SAM protein [Deltaproteobacteria bacterium]
MFLRFAACNLACTWCDTDFAPQASRRMPPHEIVRHLRDRDVHGTRMVVVTGGEPTLQWDGEIAGALSQAGFRVHMETNGTRALHAPVDWLTVSPKPRFHERNEPLVLTSGDECKVVVDETVTEEDLAHYEQMQFDHWFLQPCHGAHYEARVRRAAMLALCRPRWRLSLQLHKIVGLP